MNKEYEKKDLLSLRVDNEQKPLVDGHVWLESFVSDNRLLQSDSNEYKVSQRDHSFFICVSMHHHLEFAFYWKIHLVYLESSSRQIHAGMTQSRSQFINVKFSGFILVKFDKDFQPFTNSDPNSSEIFIAELANASWIACSN